MHSYKKILVPTDFSECASEATRHAIDLAHKYRASLELIYVFEPIQYAVPEGYLMYSAAQMASAYDELRRYLEREQRAAHDAGVQTVTTALLEGYASDTIVERAATTHADLIVMGTHGRRGIAHAFLGSVAEKVVRKAACPVLTVHLAKKP